MTANLEKILKRLDAHAKAATAIPASEQFIGHMQELVKAAILDMKLALEAIAKEHDDNWHPPQEHGGEYK